jgi:hypothetical protein
MPYSPHQLRMKVSQTKDATRAGRPVASLSPESAVPSTPKEETEHADADGPVARSLQENAAPSAPQEKSQDGAAENPVAPVPVAPDSPKDNLRLSAAGQVKAPDPLEDGGCFEPFIPEVSPSPAPKPALEPKRNVLGEICDRALREMGIEPNPTPDQSVTELPAPAPAEAASAEPGEIHPAAVEAPLPPPRVATADEVFDWIRRCVEVQAQLPEDAAELIAFWVISTWFQGALTVLPCLVVTGPAHHARRVLHLLKDVCWRPALLAGFRRKDLPILHGSCGTYLIWEANLSKQCADLLNNLADAEFLVSEGGSLGRYGRSTAIYAGENPETHKIENSIHIHISPTNAALPEDPQWIEKIRKRVPRHLDQYRAKNLSHVHQWSWVPSRVSPVSPETTAIAEALGHGLVGSCALRLKLLRLLAIQDGQRLSELSNTTEALAIEALWAFIRRGQEQAYAWEIAAEINRLLEVRGAKARLSPEQTGKMLKRLCLPARRLSQKGNGLRFDTATLSRIAELSAMYDVEDMSAETENLHDQQAADDKQAM